ncbi:vWA domain-containing protein [Oligoflexus tunisiensis]|uniref:vWA domain-containing protein n=1 Tax=Oligoflexus tunisiensis TaxID=708132 RepID=UPI00114D062C|nr:vWA domain-containing protein [Oligoflexus tunisiensis]
MNLCKLTSALVLVILFVGCKPSKFNGFRPSRDKPTSPGLDVDEQTLNVSELTENEAKKKAGGPLPGTGTLLNHPLDLSCNATTEHSITVTPSAGADIKIQDNARVAMSVKGRFCPSISSGLTILFIIDFSGSMGPLKPDASNMAFQPAIGNDPRVAAASGKTCGRLQAAQAILSKVKAGDNVAVGTVAFAGGIVETHTKAPIEAGVFRTGVLDGANGLKSFCSYIAPEPAFADQEMAVPNPEVNSSTNYAAAFERAFEFLKNTKDRKAVYFITDGRPTAGGMDPVAAGKEAATRLKSLENLYFNAFFLQNKQAGLQEDTVGVKNLVETIGSDDRVVTVDSAETLVVEVSKDLTGSFDATDVKASLTVEPYQPEADLKINRFAMDPDNPKAWVFETQPFVLLGEGTGQFPHMVKVSAKAKDGTMHSSLVRIQYQQTLKQ